MPVVEVRKNNNGSGNMPPPNMMGTPLPNAMPKVPANGKSAMPPPMQPSSKTIDDSLNKPGKYEVSEASDFTIELFLRFHKGRWILMEHEDSKTENHKVVFRMWTYNEMVELKKMATTFDLRKKVHELDNDLLNMLKIKRFLKSWTFGEKNKRLEIQHVGGTMTDEGWTAFTRLQPSIAQYIIDEMNAVFEYNR